MCSPNKLNVMFDVKVRGIYDFGENITLLSIDPPGKHLIQLRHIKSILFTNVIFSNTTY